jgi:WD40 repeat protein
LKWNKKGDYILTGSCDETAIVWDVQAEKWKQQFDFHTGKFFTIIFSNQGRILLKRTLDKKRNAKDRLS